MKRRIKVIILVDDATVHAVAENQLRVLEKKFGFLNCKFFVYICIQYRFLIVKAHNINTFNTVYKNFTQLESIPGACLKFKKVRLDSLTILFRLKAELNNF